MEKKQERVKTDHAYQNTYKLTQTTKKLDCPAAITVTRIYALPQLKVENPTKSQRDVISANIRKKLLNNEDFDGEEAFWFTLPSADVHRNHTQGEISAITEPVDPEVRSKIKELVYEGKRNALVISELLEIFVTNDLKQKDKKRRRFFPDIPTIKGIIKEGKRDIRHSKIDMENTEKLLESYDKSDFFFRPCTKETINEEELGADEDNEEDDVCNLKWKSVSNHNFLFVYQSSNMRRLYRRYAGEAVLLDATYRTCKYAIPLYFLVVQTNVNFQVVAVIISQYETTASITEALEIVKSWSATISPKNAMVDFAYEEISALENAFPGIKVFICSFHREQAWNRWLSRGENSSVPKDEALVHLWDIANAATEEQLQQAVQNLKMWKFYDSTPLKKYFQNTWETEIQRWALAYKPDSMLLNTNNGVERLNEELKYRYLDGYRNCNLSEIISVLINSFLPERYNIYVRFNLRMSSKFMKYNKEIPSFLHERPKWIIKHIKENLEKIECNNTECIELFEQGSFSVAIQCGRTYIVKFNKENNSCSCTCIAYKRTRLPCKHCFMVGEKYKEYHISHIHKWLLSNPLFCIDTELFDPESKVLDHNIPTNNDVIPTNNDVIPTNNDVIPTNNEEDNHEKTQDAVIYGELEKRGSQRRKSINRCNSHLRNLGSILWMLPESALLDFEKDLEKLTEKIEKRVNHDDSIGLPLEVNEYKRKCNSTPMDKVKIVKKSKVSKDATEGSIKKHYGKLKAYSKRGLTGRVGMKVKAMRQSCKRIVLEDKTENTNVLIDGHFEMAPNTTSPI